MGKKTGILTDAEKEQYAHIDTCDKAQNENYAKWVKSLGSEYLENVTKALNKLGLKVDWDAGHVMYMEEFKPVDLEYEICYVRHGKTEGNTEPRIYQGQVDYEQNQLNEVGLKQADEAAEKMETEYEKGWKPDLIVFSPLGRAKMTGKPFADKHPDIQTAVVQSSAEAAFGEWDNARVIDVPHESFAHLFYRTQNACVKAEKPHVLPNGKAIPSESFIELILRMKNALDEIDNMKVVERIVKEEGRKARVLMYGHSMAGAAISVLLGHGKNVEGHKHLGFDGRYIMPNATPTYLKAKQPSF